jgi:uncharacterized membrane protein (Fun14 family)
MVNWTVLRGHCGRNRMVVGFTTTYAITTNVRVRIPLMVQLYVIKFVSDSLSVVFSINKADLHSEILLKVALNTIKPKWTVLQQVFKTNFSDIYPLIFLLPSVQSRSHFYLHYLLLVNLFTSWNILVVILFILVLWCLMPLSTIFLITHNKWVLFKRLYHVVEKLGTITMVAISLIVKFLEIWKYGQEKNPKI